MSAFQWLDDAEFGRRFIGRAVTTQRIQSALTGLTAERLRFGPYTPGPIGLASASAEGSFGRAVVARLDDGRFAVTVPAGLDFTLRVGAQTSARADVEVDLVLTPRPAEPLLLVIDVAPVQARDVRIDVSATGIAAPVTALLGPLFDEARGHVARYVNELLDSPKQRNGRTIDIGARLDGTSAPAAPDAWRWLDDADFGARFLRAAVTTERLGSGFAGLAGQPVRIGPLRAGPRAVATVRADGEVGRPELHRRDGAGRAFDAVVPLGLDLGITLKRESRYRADVTVPLEVTARPADPLVIVVDIAAVRPESLGLDVAAQGIGARLLARVGGLDARLRAQIAQHVNGRLADPSGRVVDLGARIDNA